MRFLCRDQKLYNFNFIYFFIPIFICKNCIAYHEKEWHNNDSDSQRNTLDINLNDDSDCMRKKMPTIYKELKNNILEIKNRCGSLCNIEYDKLSKETLSNETFKAVQLPLGHSVER